MLSCSSLQGITIDSYVSGRSIEMPRFVVVCFLVYTSVDNEKNLGCRLSQIQASSSAPMDVVDDRNNFFVFAIVGGQRLQEREQLLWDHEMMTRLYVAQTASQYYNLAIEKLPAMHVVRIDEGNNPLLFDDIGPNLMDEPDEPAGPGHKVLFFPQIGQGDTNPKVVDEKRQSGLGVRDEQRDTDEGVNAEAKSADAERIISSKDENSFDEVKFVTTEVTPLDIRPFLTATGTHGCPQLQVKRETSIQIAKIIGKKSLRTKYCAKTTSGVMFGLEVSIQQRWSC